MWPIWMFRRVFVFLVIMGLSSFTLLAAEQEMLTGEITFSDLKKLSGSHWHYNEDNKYQVDMAVAAELPELLQDINVTIILGTWCHDSQREVPRFYKIFAETEGDMSRIKMIAVDKKFTASGNDIDELGITNTPTFIFYRNGAEINRIVEVPVESLEKDMMAILTGQKYQHSKYRAP